MDDIELDMQAFVEELLKEDLTPQVEPILQPQEKNVAVSQRQTEPDSEQRLAQGDLGCHSPQVPRFLLHTSEEYLSVIGLALVPSKDGSRANHFRQRRLGESYDIFDIKIMKSSIHLNNPPKAN